METNYITYNSLEHQPERGKKSAPPPFLSSLLQRSYSKAKLWDSNKNRVFLPPPECVPLGLTASVIISQLVAWGDSVTATTSFQEATKSDYLCLESPPPQCYRAHPLTEKSPPPTSQPAAEQRKKSTAAPLMHRAWFSVPITKK